MDAILASKPAHTIQDVLMFNATYAIPYSVLKDLWESWVTGMVNFGKCERLPSVYDSGDLILTISV